MATKQLYWTDAHFCGLRSQTNVYSLSKITSKEELTKLLAVSINGHFITVEYQKSFDSNLIPITKEDIFFSTSHLPGPDSTDGETEIVSVDVICHDDSSNDIILAISYLRLEASYEEKPPVPYMNIYFLPSRNGNRESGIYSNIMEAISQSHIQYLSLDFIPFKLMHQPIYKEDGTLEMCFLLSGSDNKVHLYRQAQGEMSFSEDQDCIEEYFPELTDIDGCVTQMEFRIVDATHRLTAVGVQSGLVTLSYVNFATKEIEKTWTTEMDSPITSLQLFTQFASPSCPEFLDFQDGAAAEKESQPEAVNLLVASAIDPAVVFCDVIDKGLSKNYTLPCSNTQDVVLCSCIVDIDFDGENEILIGTYGQILLAYKLVQDRPPQSMLMTSTPFQSPMPVPLSHANSTPPAGEDKQSFDQEKTDNRRRHKSVAAVLDHSDGSGKQDKLKSDELSLLDGSFKDGQISRLVRSQENLASQSPRSVYFQTPDHQVSSELTLPPGSLTEEVDYPCYRLTWTKRFSDPVMSITCEDVMGDGMLDLVVLTLKGLHILQPDLNEVSSLLLERMKLICDPGSEADDDYHQLQQESLEEQT